jgi:hypothetical protein
MCNNYFYACCNNYFLMFCLLIFHVATSRSFLFPSSVHGCQGQVLPLPTRVLFLSFFVLLPLYTDVSIAVYGCRNRAYKCLLMLHKCLLHVAEYFSMCGLHFVAVARRALPVAAPCGQRRARPGPGGHPRWGSCGGEGAEFPVAKDLVARRRPKEL